MGDCNTPNTLPQEINSKSLPSYFNEDKPIIADRDINDDILVYDSKKDSFGEYYVDCGSLEKILENLMGFNLSFLNVFLDTYVLFLKPRDLFNFLIEQYEKNIPIVERRERNDTLRPISRTNTSSIYSVDIQSKNFDDVNITIVSNPSIDIDVDRNSLLDNNLPNLTIERDSTSTNITGENCDTSSNVITNKSRRETQSSAALSIQSDMSLLSSNDNTSLTQKTSRTVSLKILRKWISTYFYDFENDPSLLDDLNKFLTNAENSVDKKDPLWRQINLVSIMLKEIKKPIEKSHEELKEEDITWDILKHHEVADTLTAIEHDLFKNLKLRELLAYVFEKPEERKKKASSVVKIIENSTKLTYLVETQVVKYPSSRVRALEMETWISVLKDLHEVKNYSSMIAILGALNSTSVDRMEKTKKKVNPKKKKMRYEIEEEIGVKNYYDSLRVYLDNNTHVRAIPFLGSYITIFDRLKQNGIFTKDNKVKFKTCRHISKLLQSISTRQRYYESKEIDPKKVIYMKKILNLPSLTSNEITALSYKHEPRLSND